MTKARARPVLQKFLDACTAVNARRDIPFYVREVWMCGSMIDDARTDVGDIDLVLLTDTTDRFKTNYRERFEELAKEIGGEDVLSSRRWKMNWAESFVKRQLLCGPRKHPLLSFGDLQILKDLACPCQLIFDASKGGSVDDAILSRHPDSPGKSNRIGEKRSMPDLRAARQRLRPVSGNLAAR